MIQKLPLVRYEGPQTGQCQTADVLIVLRENSGFIPMKPRLWSILIYV